MKNKVKLVSILGSGLFGAILLISLPMIYGIIVMLLWNAILKPHGIWEIGYLESVGIYILCGILLRKSPSRLGEFLFGNIKKKTAGTCNHAEETVERDEVPGSGFRGRGPLS